MIGTTLGHYRVLGKLGEGGMGEVYRARDTRLDRDVAIKILPETFAKDAERLARFDREAKTLASLNHPNIAQIYGIEEATGNNQPGRISALVMELVGGEDLSARIDHGPIPLDEALPIARQIAVALEAAHERGVIHRDLKPANVKVRDDGAVKVLDFGLAKGVEPALTSTDAMNSPTITSPATQLGMIIGTAAYMSPEQARGKPADRRADVWAFGVILLEMLTGRRVFRGEDISDVLASVIKDTPSFESLPPATPMPIRRLLRRSLEKDRSKRLESMADARLEIDEALGASPAESAPPPAASLWMRALPWGVAALAIAAAGLMALGSGDADVRPVLHASIDAPQGHVLGEGDSLASLPTRTPIVFTADGRSLIVQAAADGKPKLFMRALDRPDARPIDGTEGAHVPFISPDGKWIGFWAANELRKVSITGGAPTTICALPAILGPNGASWGRDDVIVFGDDATSRLMKVGASGGTPSPIGPAPAVLSRRQVTPVVLPDGKRVLYAEVDVLDAGASRLMVQDIAGGDPRVVMEQAADGRLLPDGDLAFMRLGTLMVAPFDAAGARVTGEATAVMPGMMQSGIRGRLGAVNTGAGMFAISAGGTLAAIRGNVLGADQSRLVWTTAAGSVSAEPATDAPEGGRLWSAISPDGARAIVLISTPVRFELWIADWARNVWTRCADCSSDAGSIAWSADGRRLLMSRGDSLVVRTLDGSAPERVLLREPGRLLRVADWVADGRVVYLSTADFAVAEVEVKVLAPDAGAGTLLLPRGAAGEPDVSPDGKWIAYTSMQTGRREIVVQAFAPGGGRVQVSAGGGRNAAWAYDSRTVYYLDNSAPGRPGSGVYAVGAIADGAINPGTPREVLRHPDGQGCVFSRCYDIASDGKRFLFRERRASGERPSVARMDLILNWTSTLAHRD